MLFRHQECGRLFKNGSLPLKASDSSFQFLGFLLLRRQRLALRRNAGTFLLELINPVTQRGLDYPERATGPDIALSSSARPVALRVNLVKKGMVLLGHQAALSGEYSP